jgi:hypothetical protein
MEKRLHRFLFYVETVAFIVLLVVFVKTVAAVRTSDADPIAIVARRHATDLVRRVNPEASGQAIEIAALATEYSLTRDASVWRDLATRAWQTKDTREILTSRIQRVIANDRLSEEAKRARVRDIVIGTSPVAAMPGSTQGALSALSAAGANPVQVRREDGLLEFDSFSLLLIGSNAMSGMYKDYYQALGPILIEYVENGGQILILSHTGSDWAYQWLPGTVTPSSLSAAEQQTLAEQPVLRHADHMALESVEIANLSDTHTGSELHPLMSVGPLWNVYIDALVDGTARPLLAEIKHGSGRMIICQLAIDLAYGREQAATRLFDNLLAHMLREKPLP